MSAAAQLSRRRVWLNYFGEWRPVRSASFHSEYHFRFSELHMSQRIAKTKKRRSLTYLWIIGMALVLGLLIYFEKTELLYVLATLGVTALLVIVATADLGAHDRSDNTLPNAQAAGSGISSSSAKVSTK